MTINGKNHDITKADLLEVASRYNIKGASSIIETSIEAVKKYRQYALQVGVPEFWIGRIEEEINDRVALL